MASREIQDGVQDGRQIKKIPIYLQYMQIGNVNQIYTSFWALSNAVRKISSRKCMLAHLSRRLIGELIVYTNGPASVVVVVRRPQCSNIFFSQTGWPIKAKFYVELPWEGGTKVYINGPGHMTKMAATPIYGKNPSKIFFSRTGGPIFTKLGM